MPLQFQAKDKISGPALSKVKKDQVRSKKSKSAGKFVSRDNKFDPVEEFSLSKALASNLKEINTKYLSPLKHVTQNGLEIQLNQNGQITFDLNKLKNKQMIIEPGGYIKIKNFGQRMFHTTTKISEYQLQNLDSKYIKYYEYAYNFITILKQKTPKIIYQIPDKKAKCLFMVDEQHFEIDFQSGLRVTHRIPESFIDVISVSGMQMKVNYKMYTQNPQLKEIIEVFKFSLKQCLLANQQISTIINTKDSNMVSKSSMIINSENVQFPVTLSYKN